MLKSEKDAELFYAAQRKFTDRQRMIDKGWGDLDAYNQLREAEKKKERMESIRMFFWGGVAAVLFCLVFFGTNYLMHGYAI
jgi:hypothetical protein